jgi:hypothetical protein
MNYDHVNQTYEYWTKIRSLLTQKLQVTSFDDYLKKISFGKSYRWLREMEAVKIARPPLAIDPDAFIKKYGEKCVTVNPPIRPEDGMMRAIFQISTTVHVEAALMAWMENNKLQSYMALCICHKEDDELFEFLKTLKGMERTGNTEERGTGFHVPPASGFGGFNQGT